MKKRNCRKSENEKRIHEQAVKLRKMTDEQLVTAFEVSPGKAQLDKEYTRGYAEGMKKGSDTARENAYIEMKTRIMNKLKHTKGIGIVTVSKIETIINQFFQERNVYEREAQ
jgi:flagellar biosynthesis/type III secretory pathway protein FliH